MKNDNNKSQVAIIGIGCRFPAANNHIEFWQNLTAGLCSISRLDTARTTLAAGSTCQYAGLLKDIELFDAKFFNISAHEAKMMDPQQRLLLEEAWHCIEDANITLKTLQNAATGVFIGTMAVDYLHAMLQEQKKIESLTAIGNFEGTLSNRISYCLNLTGESKTINTACASSFYALHDAFQRIQNDELDFAFVGAANLLISSVRNSSFSQARMLTPTNYCKTFDLTADGYVPGEGVAVVLLTKLETAIDGNYPIYGILHHVAVNHNGSNHTLTAPSVRAQKKLLEEAVSKINNRNLDYIEAHGTGTTLGDLIEWSAMEQVFKDKTNNKIPVGSVKTNIGHLEAAAGLAGLIKTLMMLKYQSIPKHLHTTQPNPLLDVENSILSLCVTNENRQLSLIGINSLGSSGANAHVIVGSADSMPSSNHYVNDGSNDYPLLISAKNKDDLRILLDEWKSWILDGKFASNQFKDLAYTSVFGRNHLGSRYGKFIKSPMELLDCLSEDNPHQEISLDLDDEYLILKLIQTKPKIIYASGRGVLAALSLANINTNNLLYDITREMKRPEVAIVLDHFAIMPNDISVNTIQDIFSFSILEPDKVKAELKKYLQLYQYQHTFRKYLSAFNIDITSIDHLEGKALWILAIAVQSSLYKILYKWNLEDKNLTINAGWRIDKIANLIARDILQPEDCVASYDSIREKLNNADITNLIDLSSYLSDAEKQHLAHAYRSDEHKLILTYENDIKLSIQIGSGNYSAVHQVNESLMKLWSFGLNIDWKFYFNSPPYKRVALPKYPFQREYYWFQEEKPKKQILYQCERVYIKPESNLSLTDPILLVTCKNTQSLAASLITQITDKYVFTIQKEQLVNDVKNTLEIKTIIYFIGSHHNELVYLFKLVKVLMELGYHKNPLELKIVSINHNQGAACFGFMQSCAKEYPNWSIRLINLSENYDDIDAAIILQGNFNLAEPAFINQEHVYRRILKPLTHDIKTSGFVQNGVYLLIGGGGGIGLALAEYLIKHYRANVVITGRSELKVDKPELLDKLTYHKADSVIKTQLEGALSQTLKKYGKIDAIFHLAVDIPDSLIVTLNEENLTNQIRDAHLALMNILSVCEDYRLVVISSIQSWFSNLGASVYSAWACMKEAIVKEAQSASRKLQLITLGIIDQLGLAAKRGLVEQFNKLGIELLNQEELFLGINHALASQAKELIIASLSSRFCPSTDNDIESKLEQYAASRVSSILQEHSGHIDPKYQNLVRKLESQLCQYNSLSSDQVKLIRDELLSSSVQGRLELLDHCLQNYADILSNKQRAISVVFPEGSTRLVEKFYSNHPIADTCNEVLADRVAKSVQCLIKNDPTKKVKILEVGAGTGASTDVVLAKIAKYRQNINYHFTDISMKFIHTARIKYSGNEDFIQFGILDIEKDLAKQGYLKEYDIIIATNAIHATKNIEKTLSLLKSLLYQDGILLLNELTQDRLYTTIVFGLLDGWWLAQDPKIRLPNSPLLSCEQWSEILKITGFENINIHSDINIEGKSPQTVITAQSSDAKSQLSNKSLSRQQIMQSLKESIVTVLGESVNVDEDTPFEDYGLDSLLITEVNANLNKEFGAIPVTLLFECNNLSQVCDYLLDNHMISSNSSIEILPETDEMNGIAIIGLSFNFPGGTTTDQFWEMLASGQDMITAIPTERWPSYTNEAYGYAKSGSFISNVDQFDPLFFKISPHNAELMDPQERLFLQTAYHALEDAGLPPFSLNEQQSEIGVFVGVTNSYYPWLTQDNWQQYRHINTSSSYWSVANRVSYAFNLQGPSLAIDTACSSSLTAIHQACNSLKLGECRTAIAGGVSLILHPRQFKELCDLNMLTPEMRNKSFAEGADGFVYGEGIAAIVLKPLRDAIKDKNKIHAVIKGSAINSGGHTHGYTVPNPIAQSRVIMQAYGQADIDSRTITYIESHGTGTALGDPIEIRGLQHAFSQHTQDKQFCAIGSIKSNIGHLQAAAGMASLIKVILQMQKRKLVPTLHCASPNSHINFSESAFYLQKELTDWYPMQADRELKLRAGVSSFGAGGANAHVILEEAPISVHIPQQCSNLFVWSGKSKDALRKRILMTKEWLITCKDPVNLNDLAYTLLMGRDHFEHRAAIVANTIDELIEYMNNWLANKYAAPVNQHSDQHDLIQQGIEYESGNKIYYRNISEINQPNFISIPVYPFTTNRYWLPQLSSHEEFQHPLIRERQFDDNKHIFKVRLVANEFYFVDHLLDDIKILPGVVHLEMVQYCAHELIDNDKQFETSIDWLQPITLLDNHDIHLHAILIPNAGGYQYKITDENQMIIYSRGEIRLSDHLLSVENKKYGEILSNIPCELFYRNFRNRGWIHGKAFRSVNAITRHDNLARAIIALPDTVFNETKKYLIHPSLFDGILQTVSVLQNTKIERYIPFSVKSLHVTTAVPDKLYVEAIEIFAGDEIVKYNIQFFDLAGTYIGELKEFCMRPLTIVKPKSIKSVLIEQICTLQKLEEQQLDADTKLGDYGFDSISYSLLALELNDLLQTSLTPATFFQYSTINSLLQFLQAEYPHLCMESSNLMTLEEKEIQEPVSASDDETSIAIIGLSGLFPQGTNCEEFWDLIFKSKTAISEIPLSRRKYFQASEQKFPQYGGFIDKIEQFDADFFGISSREAELMDPQQRLILKFIWEAVESSGYTPTELASTTTGSFIGVSTFDYAKLLHQYGKTDPYLAPGTVHSVVANRVSYLFDWTGPSEAIDTACSSSLVALHHGVKAIQNKDCEVAVIASVSALLESSFFIAFNQAGMLSSDGVCKTFDKDANGYGRAEGGGALILKSLAHAKRDGDNILGVIRASGVNHGGRANTLTSPNPISQAKLLRDVYRKANIESDTITYIEAHGTGTALGDPIEVNALKQIFKSGSYCVLGSVKANIGHLEAASGLAGVIKILLMFKHGVLPPQANFKELNPYIDLSGSPFQIITAPQNWRRLTDSNGKSLPRRAGVSSFGFGGSNAHVVLEEPPSTQKLRLTKNQPNLIVISARTEEALHTKLSDLQTWLCKEENHIYPTCDIGFTLAIGRVHFGYRCALVAENREDLLIKLETKDFQLSCGDVSYNKQGLNSENVANLNILADYYCKGAQLDFTRIYSPDKNRRISLPTYPFQEERYWFEEAVITSENEIYYAPDWQMLGLLDQNKKTVNLHETLFITHPGSQDILNSIRLTHGNEINEINLANFKDFDMVFFKNIETIVYLGGLWRNDIDGNQSQLEESQEYGLHGLYRLVKSLIHRGIHERALQIKIITNDVYRLSDSDNLCPYGASLHGFSQSLANEYPKWHIVNIDISAKDLDGRNLLDVILNETGYITAEPIIYRNNIKYRRYLTPIKLDEVKVNHLQTNGVYVLLGGAGGIGFVLAQYLVNRHAATIILIGKSPLNADKQEKIDRMITKGAQVTYYQADITNEIALMNVFEQINELHPVIHGVINLAMKLTDCSIANMALEDLQEVCRPKTFSMSAIKSLIARVKIKKIIIFSSAQSFMPQAGQSNYAAASMLQDAYAEYLSTKTSIPVVVVNWTSWAEAGAVANDFYITNLEKQGIRSLRNETALKAFAAIISSGLSQVAVLDVDIEKIKPTLMNAREKSDTALHAINDYAAQAALKILQELGYFNHTDDCYDLSDLIEGKKILPQYKRYLAALIDLLMAQKILHRKNNYIQLLNRESQQENFDHLHTCKDYFGLLDKCTQSASSILTGKLQATDVLFGAECKTMISNLYSISPIANHYNQLLSAAVVRFVTKCIESNSGDIHILEVGAGTGASTSMILSALKPFADKVKYYFTDISQYFITQASAKFGNTSPTVICKVLDITSSIQVEKKHKQFDLIIATNVLHAVPNINQVIKNCHAMLKANGELILNEAINKQTYLTVIFGLLKDWWASTDSDYRIPHSPLLATHAWVKVLAQQGFMNINTELTASHYETFAGQSIITAQKYVEPINSNIENNVIEEQMRLLISTILKTPLSKIHKNRPFAELGLDSISGVNFIQEVNQRFSSQLKTTAIFHFTTIEALAQEVSNKNQVVKVKKLMFAGL